MAAAAPRPARSRRPASRSRETPGDGSRPGPCVRSRRAAMLRQIACSDSGSSALVTSSRISSLGRRTSARARAMRCRWPPDSRAPLVPTTVRIPSGSAATKLVRTRQPQAPRRRLRRHGPNRPGSDSPGCWRRTGSAPAARSRPSAARPAAGSGPDRHHPAGSARTEADAGRARDRSVSSCRRRRAL